jgi:hypothetical protein
VTSPPSPEHPHVKITGTFANESPEIEIVPEAPGVAAGELDGADDGFEDGFDDGFDDGLFVGVPVEGRLEPPPPPPPHATSSAVRPKVDAAITNRRFFILKFI